jgi:hypothetical protein
MAAYSFDHQTKELAPKKGLYLFSRYGQKIKPLNNENFVVREF